MTTTGSFSRDRCGPGSTLPTVHHRHAEHRLLDLRTGTLARGSPTGSGLRSIRFISAASPHAMALRAEARAGHIEPGDPLRSPLDAQDFKREEMSGHRPGPNRRWTTQGSRWRRSNT